MILIKALTELWFLGSNMDKIGKLQAESVGWTSWEKLMEILKITREKFKTNAEKQFADDLILYLDYKIREAERIRNERRQPSFW